MLSLPNLKEDSKYQSLSKQNNSPKNRAKYDYFSNKSPKTTIDTLLSIESDERFVYFLRYGQLRRFEGKGDIIYVEIPQIPKNLVVYRKPSCREKNIEKLNLDKKDLPQIPLLEGEENLKLLSLETNFIYKIDHLISLNNLLFLNLYQNKISEIDNLQNVPKLRALMLGKNNISKIKNLQCLHDIEVLDLHSNQIKLIENLSCLKKLRIINFANNQISSFAELINNQNLEDINLRKNLIVSIPNLYLSFTKLKKMNLGKNMISKIEFILEFSKIKTIEELNIEGNPVIFIRDSYQKLNSLPLKFKDQSQFDLFKNNVSNFLNESKSKIEKKGHILNIRNLNYKNRSAKSILTMRNLEENKKNEFNSSITNNTERIKSNTKRKNNSIKYTNKRVQDNLSMEDRDKLLYKIYKEWINEYEYITINGLNGYSIKKLKETKMKLCHAEIERERQLNLYGNSIEVLGYKACGPCDFWCK